MHELAIAESIVEAVQNRARGGGSVAGDRIQAVHIRVGRLSGVLPDALSFCFDLATAGTELEGAVLVVEEPEGRLYCRTCGQETVRNDLLLLCDCGSADVDVRAGRELAVLRVEVR